MMHNDVNIKRAHKEYNGRSASHVKRLLRAAVSDDEESSIRLQSVSSIDYTSSSNDSAIVWDESSFLSRQTSGGFRTSFVVKQQRLRFDLDFMTKEEAALKKEGKRSFKQQAEEKPRSSFSSWAIPPTPGAISITSGSNHRSHNEDDMYSVADCVHIDPTLITAHVVTENDDDYVSDLRDQVRMEIFSETVEAQVIKSSFWSRNKCFLLFILLLVIAVVVGAIVWIRGNNNDSTIPPFNKTSDAPSEAPSFSLPESLDLDLNATLELERLLQPISTTSVRAPGSPQRKAFIWLAGQQPQDTNNQTIIQQYILAVIYYSLGGESWTNKLNFLSTLPFCEWGRPRFALSNLFGVKCNKHRDIASLGLSSNQLFGTIPNEIGHLSTLTKLYLETNAVRGTLPTTLGLLTNLQVIEATENAIEGTLPRELFELTRLKEIWLGGNSGIIGTIPANMANATSLEVFSLIDADLSGSLPESLGIMSKLRALDVTNNNKMGGPLPTFGNNINLRNFHISETFIGGTIPSTVGNLINLNAFEAADTNISGTIPIELANLARLELLHISPRDSFSGGLTGTIPTFQGLKSRMQLFSLLGNSLSGNLDALFNATKLPSLQTFDLDGNELTGTIPTTVGLCTDVRFFDLRHNRLTGPIPTEIGNLVKVDTLTFESNSLTGTIPSEIGKLTSVSFLIMSSNALTGTLPKELGFCSRLRILSLRSNQFTGSVPLSMSNLRRLEEINLEMNQLKDNFTDTFCAPETQKRFKASIRADCADEIVCDCCSLCCSMNGNCIEQ